MVIVSGVLVLMYITNVMLDGNIASLVNTVCRNHFGHGGLHVSCCQRWMGLARVNRLPRAQIPCVGPTNEGQHRSQVSGRSFSVELLNRLMSH